MTVRTPIAAALLLLLIALTISSTAGCGSDSASQTEVVAKPVAEEIDDDTLTPLERGALRREILQLTEKAILAWQAGDTSAMQDYFAEDLVAKTRTAEQDHAAAGQRRVRVHERVFLDVIDMNNVGTQALVEYRFNDGSHLLDSSGSKVEEPSGKEQNVQITLEKSDEGWLIVRVIGAPDILS